MCISAFGNVMSSSSRFILNKKKRLVYRLIPFVVQYCLVHIPLLYRFLYYYYPRGLVTCNFLFAVFSTTSRSNNNNNNTPVDSNATANFSTADNQVYHYGIFKNKSDLFYIVQFLAACGSAFFYALHVPERMWPGKFDVLGQSHQIFHLTSFLTTWAQLQAIKCDMNEFIIEHFHMSQFFQIDNEFLIVKNLERVQVSEFKIFRYSSMPYFDLKLSYSFIMFLSFAFNFFILVYYYCKAVYDNPWDEHNSLHQSKSEEDLENKRRSSNGKNGYKKFN
jgi:hypothetical protein